MRLCLSLLMICGLISSPIYATPQPERPQLEELLSTLSAGKHPSLQRAVVTTCCEEGINNAAMFAEVLIRKGFTAIGRSKNLRAMQHLTVMLQFTTSDLNDQRTMLGMASDLLPSDLQTTFILAREFRLYPSFELAEKLARSRTPLEEWQETRGVVEAIGTTPELVKIALKIRELQAATPTPYSEEVDQEIYGEAIAGVSYAPVHPLALLPTDCRPAAILWYAKHKFGSEVPSLED